MKISSMTSTMSLWWNMGVLESDMGSLGEDPNQLSGAAEGRPEPGVAQPPAAAGDEQAPPASCSPPDVADSARACAPR
jgi:hypothetical protein